MDKNKSVVAKAWICGAIVIVLLAADQILKIWIKTHFVFGGDMALIGEWCRLHFIENNGIAFGMSFGGSVGKLILSLFRLVASVAIVVLLVKYIKRDARYLMLISMSLILMGAIGNLVDSCFYGMIFSESTRTDIAILFPEGGGYGTFLHGKVVDMFYFPLFQWTWPEWVPIWGGGNAEFFNAIFNIADSAVTVGVALLIFDQIRNSRKSGETEVNEVSPISENRTENEPAV